MRHAVFAAVLLAPLMVHAQDEEEPSAAELRELLEAERQRNEEQEARLKELERRVQPASEAPPEAEAPPEPAEPAKSPWTDEIRLGLFYIESADGAHRLEVRGRLQVDGRFIAEHGHDDVDDSFQIRRARIEFRGHLFEKLAYDIGLEFGRTSDADLRNAFIELQLFDALQVRAGQMLLPYSDERLMSSKYLNHPERSILVANMVGERDIGAMVHGRLLDDVLHYYVGMYNGEGQNTKVDTDDDFDFATRLEVRPLGDDTLMLSLNYIYSPTNRAHSGPDDVRTVGNELSRFLDYASTNRALGSRQRVGGGVRFATGPLSIHAEANMDYHREVVSAAGADADLMTWGYYVDVFYVVTGESMTMKGDGARVDPDSPLYDPATEAFGPGAFALAVRFEDFYADPSAVERGFATGTDTVRAVTATAHWYMWESVRLSASYIYSHFQDGVREADGDRHIDEHAVLVRWAMYF